MWRVTCTGKNLCWGKQGERIEVSNEHYNSAKKNDYFYPKSAKYAGSGRLVIKILGAPPNEK